MEHAKLAGSVPGVLLFPLSLAAGMALAMLAGFLFVAVISNLPNDIAKIFGTQLYVPPKWLPIMEFPWWICCGTIVTFLVAVSFRAEREHFPPA